LALLWIDVERQMSRTFVTRLEFVRPGRRLAAALCVGCSLLLAVAPSQAQAGDGADESSAEERAKVRVFEALDLMDAGSYGEARLMLQLALGLNSELDRAWYYLAQCNVQLKNWSEALEALSKYEAANLSEHERMQIADLRGKIQELQAAAAAEAEVGDDWENEGEGDWESEGEGDWESEDEAKPAKTTTRTKTAKPRSEGKLEAAAAAATAPGRVPAVAGPAMLILGGIVAGVGLGVVIRSIDQGNAALAAGDEQALKAGRTPYGVGMGAMIGGGAVFAIGIPLSIAAKKAPARVAISFAADTVQPGAAVYLVGRW
jgi:tetratricopeptide (TPR) repeat protein